MKLIPFLLLIAVLGLAGCTNENTYAPEYGGRPGGNPGVAGRMAVNYFPLAVGDSVGYRNVPSNYSPSARYMFVAGVQQAEGVKVYTIRNFGILEGQTDSLFEARTNGDVYTVQSINPLHETLLFRTQVPVGTSWNVDTASGTSATLDATGVTVTTEAGTFTNCLQIVFTVNLQGFVLNYADCWLAPNVGIVQYLPNFAWVIGVPTGGVAASDVRLKPGPRILPVGAGLSDGSYLPFAVGTSIGYRDYFGDTLPFVYVSGVKNYKGVRTFDVQNFAVPLGQVDTLFDVRPDGDVYTVEYPGTDSMSEALLFQTNVPTGTTWYAPRAGFGFMAGWGETWTTDAGTFTNCIVIQFISDAEADVYVFAPNVGVVFSHRVSMLGTTDTDFGERISTVIREHQRR